MNPRLRVEVGRQANFEYEVPPSDEEEAVWLGRGAFCQIRISDPQLSRRHSQFTFDGGRLFVEDLGSRNGTRVNDELIQGKVQLEHDDRVTVGSHQLVVVYPPASAERKVDLAELGTREAEQEAYDLVAALKGEELSGYQLEDIVFNGDISVVFRGRDPERDIPVAVKVLKPLDRVTVEVQNRFIRGAKHGALLRHPNFVRVLKGGRSGDWFFVAMEFVEGRNLQAVIDRAGKPLKIDQALQVERQVLDALQHAYEQDIVFRAVRPDNVIVCKGMQAKLTDFDLVKPLAGRQDSQVTRVMDGSLSVDPSFAAPELIAYPAVADQKADVFGAGAVLYYMLCARPPFRDVLPSEKASSAFDRVVQAPGEVNPAIPESICAVIRQAMSDYERYNTPADMRRALDARAAEAGL